MLKESMQARPNIYQVLKEACAMQGRKVPIPDVSGGSKMTYEIVAKSPLRYTQSAASQVRGQVNRFIRGKRRHRQRLLGLSSQHPLRKSSRVYQTLCL